MGRDIDRLDIDFTKGTLGDSLVIVWGVQHKVKVCCVLEGGCIHPPLWAGSGSSLPCHVLLHLVCLKHWAFLGRIIPSSFMSTFFSCLYHQDPPLPLSPFPSYPILQYLHTVWHLFLHSAASFELILQLCCPPHTFWMCPLSCCDVAIAGTGEAMPHSSTALVGWEFAPSLLQCDLSAGPLVGE